jgi:hypothetical protein
VAHETCDAPAIPGPDGRPAGRADHPETAVPYSTRTEEPAPTTHHGPGDEVALAPDGAGPQDPSGAAGRPRVRVGPSVPGDEIRGLLGRGGMGVVYHALQSRANQPVALKMILGDVGVRPDHLERFRIEAESVARLRHPNVVQIYEVGKVEGLPFFSLELLEGGTLADRLAGLPMPPRPAAELLLTILFDRDGVPKVTDFGLAKRLDVQDGLTLTHVVMGTPAYMAPEQALGRNREVGPRADVYALGAIFYAMLTGRPPLQGTTWRETLLMVSDQKPVSPSRLQPKIPRDLETICLKCLAKEPPRRYGSAGALADFEAVLRLDPSDADGYAGRGAARARLRQHRDAVADAEESLRRGEATPLRFYSAARTYAQALAVAVGEVPRRGRPALREAYAYEGRAVALLTQALERTPADRREGFWREVVEPDVAMEVVRRRARPPATPRTTVEPPR